MRDTLDEVAAGYGRMLHARFDARIYLASASTMLDLVRETSADVSRLLLVGHNPGLEELALELGRGDADSPMLREVEIKYPTATTAELRLSGGWDGFGRDRATLVRFTRPRDLDAALGLDLA